MSNLILLSHLQDAATRLKALIGTLATATTEALEETDGRVGELEARTVDGFSYGSAGAITHYGTCPTAAGTAAKVATCGSAFTLKPGAYVQIKFTYSNTSSSPTLNVNGTGALSITSYGTTAAVTYEWRAGGVVGFVYDGTSWIIEDGTIATTTYYGRTKLSSSTSSTSTSLAATPSAVKTAYDAAVAAQSTADEALAQASAAAESAAEAAESASAAQAAQAAAEASATAAGTSEANAKASETAAQQIVDDAASAILASLDESIVGQVKDDAVTAVLTSLGLSIVDGAICQTYEEEDD